MNLKNNLLSWHKLIYDSDWMIYWPIKSDSRISNNVCYNEWDSNNCLFELGIRWILRKYARWLSNVFSLVHLPRPLIGWDLYIAESSDWPKTFLQNWMQSRRKLWKWKKGFWMNLMSMENFWLNFQIMMGKGHYVIAHWWRHRET